MIEPTTRASRATLRGLLMIHQMYSADEAEAFLDRYEAEARADAPDVDALERALLNGVIPARHWLDAETTTENFARWLAVEYARQRAKRKQDAATDEAEQEWIKPLPKDIP